MSNPYRNRGYSAKLEETEVGDFLQIYRNDELICEVTVSVFPEGPEAQASIIIKRFMPGELRSVSTTDDFEGRDEE